jgi:hypothetical protein
VLTDCVGRRDDAASVRSTLPSQKRLTGSISHRSTGSSLARRTSSLHPPLPSPPFFLLSKHTLLRSFFLDAFRVLQRLTERASCPKTHVSPLGKELAQAVEARFASQNLTLLQGFIHITSSLSTQPFISLMTDRHPCSHLSDSRPPPFTQGLA